MGLINGLIIISLLFAIGFLGSFISFLTDNEKSRCEMTYMFEFLQFVEIKTELDYKYPKYGLYAYSEGRMIRKTRSMHFDGIPVVFIPGSGGSHKQVRSLASIALRKHLNSRTSYHFDYFTVDLNGELCGLNGVFLYDQLEYVNASIHTVLQLYKTQRRPKQIVVIGHSMGGIIAKAFVAQHKNLVPILITLATPHTRPPLSLDYYAAMFYTDIEKYGLINTNETTIISVAGGYNDLLINTHLTQSGQLDLVSTCVPKSWLTVDHLAILWCKQLVLAINRALFDSVDMKTKQISTDATYRMQVFKHNLIKHSGTKIRLRDRYNDVVTLTMTGEGDWIEKNARQYTENLERGTKVTQWYMVPFIDLPQYGHLSVVALNLEQVEWVYVCKVNAMKGSMKYCQQGNHLTQFSKIAPSLNYKRRSLDINLHNLKKRYPNSTHVVVKVMPTSDPVILHFDIHDSNSRTMVVSNLPRWFMYMSQTVVPLTDEKILKLRMMLPKFNHIIQSYQLYLEPIECTAHTHHATASLIVPWAHQDTHGYVTDDERSPINLRLYASRPRLNSNQSAYIDFKLDPSCRYKISLRNTLHFGNMARHYLSQLPANFAAVLLLSVRLQFKTMAERERFSVFFEAIKDGAKPYYFVTVSKILATLLSAKALSTIPFTKPDWFILMEEGLDFLVLPLVMFLVSVGLIYVMAMGIAVSLVFFESTFHKFALKFVSRTMCFGRHNFSDYIMKACKKLPGIVACFLVALSATTCGSLALFLAAGFYFWKLTQMSQDFIEDLVWNIVKSIGRKLKRRFLKRSRIRPVSNENETLALAASDIQAIESSAENDGPTNERNETSESADEQKPEEEKEEANKTVANVDETNESAGTSTCSDIAEVTPVDNQNKSDDSEPEESLFDIWEIFKDIFENNEIYFHFTMLLLYVYVAIANVTTVVTWARNFSYSRHLSPDPSFIPGVVLSVCAFFLWQFDLPKVDRKYCLELSYVMYAAAIFCVLYGSVAIYRLSYVMTAVIVIITIHQICGFKKPPSESVDADEDGPKTESYEEKVKSKLE